MRYAVGLGGVGAAAVAIACSGGGSSGAVSAGSDGGGSPAPAATLGADAGSVSTVPGSCPNPTVPIVFSPMYSAFIAGSTAQTFAIPAVTADGSGATWSLSDPTQGNLQVQSFENGGVSIPGVLITVAGTGAIDGGADGPDGGVAPGQVTVIATEADGTCGAAVLDITSNVEDDWNIGNARYNDGVALHVGRPAGFDASAPRVIFDGGFEGGPPPRTSDGGSYFETAGGTACTNCHGPTATNGPYKTVSHTPEQTGGFSDGDLQNIIWNGEVPDGGYFDPSVLVPSCDGGATCTAQAYALWHSFHQWTDITADELPGVICYLRALTPESQNGTSNFGGGGVGRRRDAGAGK